MERHEDRTADSGERDALRDARAGRAAAMSRRRALAAGRLALTPAQERVRTGFRKAEFRAPATVVCATPSAPSRSQGAPSRPQGAPRGTPVAIDGVAAARLGRALSMQRRRQLSQGKQALNAGGDRTATAAGAGARAFIVYPGGAG